MLACPLAALAQNFVARDYGVKNILIISTFQFRSGTLASNILAAAGGMFSVWLSGAYPSQPSVVVSDEGALVPIFFVHFSRGPPLDCESSNPHSAGLFSLFLDLTSLDLLSTLELTP